MGRIETLTDRLETDRRLLTLSPRDNVAVAKEAIPAGETFLVSGREIIAAVRIGLGHKVALRPIRAGEKVLKYGVPIGSATADIAVGDHVHLHNIRSDYTPTHSLDAARADHIGERNGEGR
ncbi:UxaA family hydrolase [Hoeflea poritis]|uniref:UxaA family hydrolase n=1 Tax=Hoeflea poritis TaxID=2993659 RepID=A0ABT4VJW9_9HYPH|nr:UxaA family hydrolase [Hoeflea poritis]MDA4845007.1 UxaA family hydrolase [Hoeflea poritis]